MPNEFSRFPISDVLGEIESALSSVNNVVIAAPPGAGKTTIVPIHLLKSNWMKDGKIILIEPRRLAARAAARRMAHMLGEELGQTVGYRMRLDNRVGKTTKIEVVTEGVFTRMVLDDPELSGIACVIFDEFHERALEADFGLALALDVQSGFREDLRIIVMSATLDIDEISRIMPEAKTIVSEGRSYPIDIRYKPRKPQIKIEHVVADAVLDVLKTEEGSILCFLPGMGEIKRVFERLDGKVTDDTDIYPLYGALSSAEQDKAIQPAHHGRRKVVLATSIAETSITIDGVRIVIDAGLQRQAFYEVASGITRLETQRASQAATTQRAGRAGRTASGIALRLWQKEQQSALEEFSPPQILTSDLSGFILDCLAWGISNPNELTLITQPPAKTIDAAFDVLAKIGAIDEKKRLTKFGHSMRMLALPVRLSAMVMKAAETQNAELAAKLAVLITEQGLGGNMIDLSERLKRFGSEKGQRAKAARDLAKRIARSAEKQVDTLDKITLDIDDILAIGFPDRIAKRRGMIGQYKMSGGRGAVLEETERLAQEDMLVIADLTGKAQAPRILSAVRFDPAGLDLLPKHLISETEEYRFDKESLSVKGRLVRKFGAISLSEKPLPKPNGEAAVSAITKALSQLESGYAMSLLPFSKATLAWRNRSEFYRHHSQSDDWSDMSDRGLLETIDQWFGTFQTNINSLHNIKPQSLSDGIKSLLSWEQQTQLEAHVPTHFTFADGKRLEINYKDDDALLSVRVNYLYGQNTHPAIMSGKVLLLLELLSPAGRPVQLTRDLPGFWQGSWRDVRADMRSRYPKHDWPDDPANAKPFVKRSKP